MKRLAFGVILSLSLVHGAEAQTVKPEIVNWAHVSEQDYTCQYGSVKGIRDPASWCGSECPPYCDFDVCDDSTLIVTPPL